MELKRRAANWLHGALDGLFWVGVVLVLATIFAASPVAALLVVLIYLVLKRRNDPHLFERVGARIDEFLR